LNNDVEKISRKDAKTQEKNKNAKVFSLLAKIGVEVMGSRIECINAKRIKRVMRYGIAEGLE